MHSENGQSVEWHDAYNVHGAYVLTLTLRGWMATPTISSVHVYTIRKLLMKTALIASEELL
jgi:hypothetical protein